jgi:hypothetical protein
MQPTSQAQVKRHLPQQNSFAGPALGSKRGERTLKTSNVSKYVMHSKAEDMHDATLNGWYVIGIQSNDGSGSGAGVVTFSQIKPPAHDAL